jgi:hypothetical protein
MAVVPQWISTGAERLQQVPDGVKLFVGGGKTLHRRLVFDTEQAERLDCMFDFFETFAAAPGVDHAPAGQKHIRIIGAEFRQVIVAVQPAGGAMFGVPGDGNGQHIVAPEILGDLAVRPRLELSREHFLRRGDEGQAGLDIFRVHRVDVNVNRAQFFCSSCSCRLRRMGHAPTGFDAGGVDVSGDQHDAGPVVGVRPGGQRHRRVHDVMHAVDHHRHR